MVPEFTSVYLHNIFYKVGCNWVDEALFIHKIGPEIQKIQKSRNQEIQKFSFFWKSEKPSQFRSFWHQRICSSSFRSWDMARNPDKNPGIQKYRNPKNPFLLKIWKALKNPVILTPADVRWLVSFSRYGRLGFLCQKSIFGPENTHFAHFWAKNDLPSNQMGTHLNFVGSKIYLRMFTKHILQSWVQLGWWKHAIWL